MCHTCNSERKDKIRSRYLRLKNLKIAYNNPTYGQKKVIVYNLIHTLHEKFLHPRVIGTNNFPTNTHKHVTDTKARDHKPKPTIKSVFKTLSVIQLPLVATQLSSKMDRETE